MRSPSARVVTGFFEQTRLRPDRIAFGFGAETYTYGQTMALVQRVMRVLAGDACRQEAVIGVLATPDVRTYASILAILASGRAYLPIHPQQPHERNWSCLDQAGTHVLLQSSARSDFHQWLVDREKGVMVLDVSAGPDAGGVQEPAAITSDGLAYLLFTSGSTGTPKGVPIYHRNLEAFFSALLNRDDMSFGPDDRFLQMFDLTFDLSIMSAFTPMLVGASSHIPEAKGAGYLSVLRVLEQQQISVALMVPSVLAFLERYFDEIRLPHLKCSLFCGEALPVAHAARWCACVPNARIFNVYGPTEATIFCTAYEVPRRQAEIRSHLGVVSIGKAMTGTRLVVVDDSGRLAPAGEVGELCLAGNQVTDGYWRNPQKTESAFVSVDEAGGRLRVYKTGDTAFERDDHFYYCGRTDHQVKIAGYRVELGEIEFHARKMPGVANAAAVATKDAGGNYVLHLFVEGHASVGEDALTAYRAYLAKELPSYMVPQRITPLAALPLNPNGKIDRQQLAERVASI